MTMAKDILWLCIAIAICALVDREVDKLGKHLAYAACLVRHELGECGGLKP